MHALFRKLDILFSCFLVFLLFALFLVASEDIYLILFLSTHILEMLGNHFPQIYASFPSTGEDLSCISRIELHVGEVEKNM